VDIAALPRATDAVFLSVSEIADLVNTVPGIRAAHNPFAAC
jgi:hypothetical protein